MVLENLDRTQWSFAETLAHVETVVVAHRAVEASRLPAAPRGCDGDADPTTILPARRRETRPCTGVLARVLRRCNAVRPRPRGQILGSTVRLTRVSVG
jgi:hypothetical protein